MKSKRLKIACITAGAAAMLVVGVATESFGQNARSLTRQPTLIGNPRRDAGGSCVYNKDGKVVFAPAGKHCPDATDHLSVPSTTDSPIVASYPPSMQGEVSRLLGDHDHIAWEIARLRQAIVSPNREIALEAADKIHEELTVHRAREERFIEKMAPNRNSP